MKKVIFIFGALFLLLVLAPEAKAANLSIGNLIKASSNAVYYYGQDGKRYVFPNEKTYKTWYADFSTVQTITDEELAGIQIGGNVTYKPGVKMVKIETDPKVYAVSRGGNLRWIKTEELAVSLYGTDWNKKVEDVPDAFFTNYLVGSPLESSADYDVADELATATSINVDKFVYQPTPPAPVVTPPAVTYSWNVKTANNDIYTHKNLALGAYGEGFLATWNDDRNGQNEIFYQKMGVNGAALGDAVKVSNNITDSINGKSNFNGVNLYVLWEDSSVYRRAIYLQKYDMDGNQLATRVFASTTYSTSVNVDFVWNATLNEYGAVWWDTKSTPDDVRGHLYFARFNSGGLRVGDELRVGDASLTFKPLVISAGDQFAIVWKDENNKIKFAKVDNRSILSGSVIDVVTTAQAGEPRIAWNGSGFGVVWADKNGGDQDIYFMSLDASGNPTGSKINLTSGTGDATEPNIAWFGGKYYVTYTNYKPNFSATSILSDINIVKVSESGVAESVKYVSNTSGKSYSSSIVANGTTVGVAWLEDVGGVNKIMSAVETKN